MTKRKPQKWVSSFSTSPRSWSRLRDDLGVHPIVKAPKNFHDSSNNKTATYGVMIENHLSKYGSIWHIEQHGHVVLPEFSLIELPVEKNRRGPSALLWSAWTMPRRSTPDTWNKFLLARTFLFIYQFNNLSIQLLTYQLSMFTSI